MRPSLFLDLDGVLADFDGGFPRIFGEDHRHIGEARMWELIRGRPNFFADLHAFPGAVAFFAIVEPLRPAILTAAPKSDYMNAADAKRRWVREHIDKRVHVIPTMGGSTKPAYLQHPGDILVDDYSRNCDAWAAAGGVAIKHVPGDFKTTLRKLEVFYGSLREWRGATVGRECDQ